MGLSYNCKAGRTNYNGGLGMKKYEYKCVAIIGSAKRTTKILNKYGQQGWELVSAWSIWCYFKREIE